MRRGYAYHVVFGLALVAMVALAVKWSVSIGRSVEFERESALSVLRLAAMSEAFELGSEPEPPRPGPLFEAPPLEVVPCGRVGPGDLASPARPLHPSWCVRPARQAIAAIEHKVARRRFMRTGESTLLFLLLGVCTFMLYQLVRLERRHMDRMQDFVFAVTHEMKTPLAGMKSLLQTMAAGRLPPDQVGELVGMGLGEAERLQHTIENVLVSGSLRTARYRVHLEPVRLRSFLDGLVEHWARTRGDQGGSVDLSWDLPTPEVTVQADPAALRVVLDNLLDNGFKYGGDPPEVTVSVTGGGPGQVLVTVRDHGIGFPPEEAGGLFAPFRRREDRASRVKAGAGLGLWIARTLARRMGGDLDGSSPGPGQGATFTLTVKILVDEPEGREP